MAKQSIRIDKPGKQGRSRQGGAEQVSRGQQRRQARTQPHRPWRRGPAPLVGVVVIVLALIGVFFIIAQQGNAGTSTQ